MLREWIYPKIERPLKSAAEQLHKNGLASNQLKACSLVLNLVAACLLLNGKFIFGGIIILAAWLSDLFSEILAKEPYEATPFGSFLGSFTDCYSEFFLYSGLALHFAREQQAIYLWLSLGILAGACAVNYSKARAQYFTENCIAGIFDRRLRIVILMAGTLIPPLLPLMLWILCIGSHATALQQLFNTKKQLTGGTEEQAESSTE